MVVKKDFESFLMGELLRACSNKKDEIGKLTWPENDFGTTYYKLRPYYQEYHFMVIISRLPSLHSPIAFSRVGARRIIWGLRTVITWIPIDVPETKVSGLGGQLTTRKG